MVRLRVGIRGLPRNPARRRMGRRFPGAWLIKTFHSEPTPLACSSARVPDDGRTGDRTRSSRLVMRTGEVAGMVKLPPRRLLRT